MFHWKPFNFVVKLFKTSFSNEFPIQFVSLLLRIVTSLRKLQEIQFHIEFFLLLIKNVENLQERCSFTEKHNVVSLKTPWNKQKCVEMHEFSSLLIKNAENLQEHRSFTEEHTMVSLKTTWNKQKCVEILRQFISTLETRISC